MRPTRQLIKFIRHVSRSAALASGSPHYLMLDNRPESSQLLHNYPEFRAFRDVSTWWKFFLNADVTVFPNYSPPSQPKDIPQIERMSAQLSWSWDAQENGYKVISSAIPNQIRCRPDPKKTDPVTGRVIPPDQLPKHRYASTATPSFYCPKPSIKTEDDVIYRPNLPSFEEGHGQILSQRDSELLISFLTVPYIRLPLVLTFFASEDRVHKLQSDKLKGIVDPGVPFACRCCCFAIVRFLVLGVNLASRFLMRLLNAT